MLFKIKVLGGLEVTIDCRTGGFWAIVEVMGKPRKKRPQWLYDRLSDDDRQNIETEVCRQLMIKRVYAC
jgi:hypothetical protein